MLPRQTNKIRKQGDGDDMGEGFDPLKSRALPMKNGGKATFFT
jgi:hypothetical protein